MPFASTIPDKIPPRLIRELKKEKYDNTILFALAVYGPHKMKELVNDPNTAIENRMETEIFQKWAAELKENNFINEYHLDNEVYYRITDEGEDELMNRIENKYVLRQLRDSLITGFDDPLGGSEVESKGNSISKSGYSLSYKAYVFGLLSINWRLNGFSELGEKMNNLFPDDKMSFGNMIEYNAEHYSDKPAILYEDIKYTYKELNEWMNRYANYFLSIGLKREM